MLELLVAGLCLGDWACSEAAKAYYASRPALRHFVVDARHTARDLVGETTMTTLLPLAAYAATGRSTVRLSKNCTLSTSRAETMVALTWTY